MILCIIYKLTELVHIAVIIVIDLFPVIVRPATENPYYHYNRDYNYDYHDYSVSFLFPYDTDW